jgi:hypothetical protein
MVFFSVRFSYVNFEKDNQKSSGNISGLSTLSGYFFLMTAVRDFGLKAILG